MFFKINTESICKKNSFSVALSFNKKRNINNSIQCYPKFYDPFVKFSIQLELKEEKGKTDKVKKVKKPKATKIIALDDFRKK